MKGKKQEQQDTEPTSSRKKIVVQQYHVLRMERLHNAVCNLSSVVCFFEHSRFSLYNCVWPTNADKKIGAGGERKKKDETLQRSRVCQFACTDHTHVLHAHDA